MVKLEHDDGGVRLALNLKEKLIFITPFMPTTEVAPTQTKTACAVYKNLSIALLIQWIA